MRQDALLGNNKGSFPHQHTGVYSEMAHIFSRVRADDDGQLGVHHVLHTRRGQLVDVDPALCYCKAAL
jgi:hypothetical protein